MVRYERIGSFKRSKKKEGFIFTYDKLSKALVECKCTIREGYAYIESLTNEVVIKQQFPLVKASFTNLNTRILKKYGMCIKLPTSVDCTSSEIELYFDSILLREEWMSFFLRYSLPETISVETYSCDNPDDLIFLDLPQLNMVPDYQIRPLLWRKLRICCTHLNLKDEKYNREIGLRYETIQELIDLCASGDGDILNSYSAVEDCVRMLSHVLFRPLPTPDFNEYDSINYDMLYLDPDWDYLELVHEFFFSLITCPQIRLDIIRQCIHDDFLRSYLYLFTSHDMRERGVVRVIAYNLYGRLVRRRTLIRRVFAELLSNVIMLKGGAECVKDILSVYNSIVCGFSVPIRQEHKNFVKHCILPLHRLRGLPDYADVLTKCVLLFISKDASMCSTIIQGIIHYWPKYNSQCEIKAIDEIEKIIEIVDQNSLLPVINALSVQLKRCITTGAFVVAERTLKLWDNAKFARVILNHDNCRNQSWKVISPAIMSIAETSWNIQVRKDAEHVVELYKTQSTDLLSDS